MLVEKIMDNEEKFLSKYAMKSRDSKGRRKAEEPCSIRTVFQRDRDRILHSKAFRRLKHKTQVFISPNGDHFRTRLTHTLEVSQIARTMAKALALNEDLVEAIALGHDLGHTPFGHMGEDVINELNPEGFKHYIQSLRVVDYLEPKGKSYGLNLTEEVRNGIVMHTGSNKASTLEGKLIKFADRIAYINHDIDDSIRAGILSEDDLPKLVIDVLGKSHGDRIDTMIKDIVMASLDKDEILMSEPVQEATDKLRDFMFERVYLDKTVKKETGKARHIMTELYNYYLEDLKRLPESHLRIYEETGLNASDDQVVTDYLAGMTDKYVVYTFDDLFIPKSWDNKW